MLRRVLEIRIVFRAKVIEALLSTSSLSDRKIEINYRSFYAFSARRRSKLDATDCSGLESEKYLRRIDTVCASGAELFARFRVENSHGTMAIACPLLFAIKFSHNPLKNGILPSERREIL